MVILYSKDNCPGCKLTKRWLNEHHIEYLEKNLEDNPENAKEVQAFGFTSAPIIVTSNEKWSGFNPTKLKQLL